MGTIGVYFRDIDEFTHTAEVRHDNARRGNRSGGNIHICSRPIGRSGISISPALMSLQTYT